MFLSILLTINWAGVGVQVAQFFLALTILITLHEFGHFITARWFKVRVEKFYLFFDFLFPFSGLLPFSLFKKKVGETVYGLGWFPLGGYVKLAGMVDESMDKEALALPPQPYEFRSKPAWQRLIIMLGGVIVNLILAFVIFYFLLLKFGLNKIENSSVKNGIAVMDTTAYKLGFRTGDKIIAVDGEAVKYFDDVNKRIFLSNKDVTVNRGGNNITLDIHKEKGLLGKLIVNKSRGLVDLRLPTVVLDTDPASTTNAYIAGLRKDDSIVTVNNYKFKFFDEFRDSLMAHKMDSVTLTYYRKDTLTLTTCKVDIDGTIGFQKRGDNIEDLEKDGHFRVEKQKFSVGSCFAAALAQLYEKSADYLSQLKKFAQPSTGAYKGMGGFKNIAKGYGTQWDWHAFWRFTAILSLVLAIMNMLPIPGLDGGYVLFTLIEMITGRKMNEKFMEIITTIGLVFLLCLMLYANLNDWIGWGK